MEREVIIASNNLLPTNDNQGCFWERMNDQMKEQKNQERMKERENYVRGNWLKTKGGAAKTLKRMCCVRGRGRQMWLSYRTAGWPGLLGGQKGAGHRLGHAGLHVSHQVASPARNRKGGKGTLKMVGKQRPAGIYHDWEVPVFGILINFNTLKYLISDLFLA